MAHQSAAAARQYYAEGLKREDYYTEGQEVVGKWHGKAAARLGVEGVVTPNAFAALIENRHPETGEQLTPRMKADRRVGFDFTFNAPKSLSLLHAINGDDRLVEAFRESAAETMAAMEKEVAVRVRKGGANGARNTGNMVWAEFVHFTARPVGGMPDPHLHLHAFVPNLSWDDVEGRWKAGEFHDLKKRASLYEAEFHSRLSARIEKLGYKTERTKFGWEVAGVPRELIEGFSRRTAEIDRLAAELGVTDAKGRDALGASSRKGKRRGIPADQLRASWLARMSNSEIEALRNLGQATSKISGNTARIATGASAEFAAKEAVDYAFDKLFQNHSVVDLDRLATEAVRHGFGRTSPELIRSELGRREMIQKSAGGTNWVTTLDVLAEEVALIAAVRGGKSRHAPLVPEVVPPGDSQLSAEQRRAVRHILESRDQVIIVRGAAGVGKTTLMKEAVVAVETAVEAIRNSGRRVFAFAPSAAASRETLRSEGFHGAETVARLLVDKRLQARVRGQVIWIDEAGLLGVRDLYRVLELAGSETRVLLTGDTGQHGPVARGDGLRILQRYAGLKVAEVTTVRRQEPEKYRKAVEALSKADLKTAFRRLDEIGAILEIESPEQRYGQLAADYLECSRGRRVPLVVSPTNAESALVTGYIRAAKRGAGQLGNPRMVRQLKNLQWADADKARAELYREGLVVQFNQNAPGFGRGEQLKVVGRDGEGRVLVEAAGVQKALPLKNADRFHVFEERQMELAEGDRVRLTRNGRSADGRSISNGNVATVKRFDKGGNIVLSTGAVLEAQHGHLDYGYCQTSYSSQSKSVRDVLIAQSSNSFVASSREQFYVSVSRGKETVRIYTDSRRGLEEAAGVTSARKSAVEIAGFNKESLSELMGGLGEKRWQERVQSRRGETSRDFVKDILRERRQSAEAPGRVVSWREYIDARRANVTIDGKHRAKGYPSGPGKGPANDDQKKRAYLRPTQLSLTARQQMAKAPPAEQAVKSESVEGRRPGAKERLVSGFKAAADNFRASRTRDGAALEKRKAANAPTQERQVHKGNAERAAKHAGRQKRQNQETEARKTVKQKQQQVQPQPAPKRGR